MCCEKSSYLQVSRAALRQNAESVKQYVGVPVIGVVKCDGYGVSVTEAAEAWRQAGVTMLAVSRPAEALELRKAGFQEDILLMSPVADGELLNTLLEANVILTVTNMDVARFYHHHAKTLPIRVHLAVDTGMGRFGVKWSNLYQLKAIYDLFPFRFEGIFSHFSKSFEKTYRHTQCQLARFLSVTDGLTAAGYDVGMRHIANSCAALRFPETRLDAVRIGSALVGKLCAQTPLDLRSVARFQAQVVDRKTFEAGECTGYGSIAKIKRKTEAVVVAVGHEDGFAYHKLPDIDGVRDMARLIKYVLRWAVKKPYVRYAGKRLPLVGRIGNQYTLFNATDVEIPVGAYVEVEVPLMFPRHNRRFVDE